MSLGGFFVVVVDSEFLLLPRLVSSWLILNWSQDTRLKLNNAHSNELFKNVIR